MKSFVHSLTMANAKMKEQVDRYSKLQKETAFRFRQMQKVSKSAYIIRPKFPVRKLEGPPHQSPPRKPEKIKLVSPDPVQQAYSPFPYNDRPAFMNYVLPSQPCTLANRVYNSVATRKFVNSELNNFLDQVENPNPSISPLYEPSVDPILHIGQFNDVEINWDSN